MKGDRHREEKTHTQAFFCCCCSLRETCLKKKKELLQSSLTSLSAEFLIYGTGGDVAILHLFKQKYNFLQKLFFI